MSNYVWGPEEDDSNKPDAATPKGHRKKRMIRPAVLVSGTVLVLAAAAAVAVLTSSGGGKETLVTVQPTTKTESPKAKPSPKKTLMTAEGVGIKETDTFVVDGTWKLRYAYECGTSPGNFIVSVVGSDKIPDPVVNELKEGNKGETSLHNEGKVHLKVTSTCDWSVRVTDTP